MKHFVQNDGSLDRIQEPVQVGPQPGDDGGVFQQEKLGLWKNVLEQSGLSSAARTGQHHRREILRRAPDLRLKLPGDVFHYENPKVIL
ncbi:MAG: hypothetical protein ACKV0T_06320 [Planctomycetales bacterium]